MAIRECGAGRGRLRAFRPSDPERDVRGRMAALAVLMSGPQELRRALRDSRKAARSGAAGYDPARHAALLRLLAAQGRSCGAAPAGARSIFK